MNEYTLAKQYLKWFLITTSLLTGIMLLGLLSGCRDVIWAQDELWLLTGYCQCKICTNKSSNDKGYGITASGKKARWGYVAGNWLPFGTQVKIDGLGTFTIMDRGARSLFGSKKNHIKHLDIYFPTHKQALNFGKQYKKVTVIQ